MTVHNVFQMSPSELPMLFQQNSLSIREESSAEDLTQQGREATLRSDLPPQKKPVKLNLSEVILDFDVHNQKTAKFNFSEQFYNYKYLVYIEHKDVYCAISEVNIEKKKMLNKISSFDLTLQFWRERGMVWVQIYQ